MSEYDASFGIWRELTFVPPPKLTREQVLERERDDYRARLESLQRSAAVVGVLLDVKVEEGKTIGAISIAPGQMVEQELGSWAKGAKPGMAVRLTKETFAPFEFRPAPPGKGRLVQVSAIHDDLVEYSVAGQVMVARCGLEGVKAGDRVVLNPSEEVVLRNLGSGGTARVVEHDTGVDWDDIGGHVEAKRQLREAIEEPVTRGDVYKRFGRKPCKGIAMFGPPGTGKTMLAKAAATALATVHGKTAKESGFIFVNGPELLDKWVGESEAKVRALFASAREHKAKHGYPAIIFLDEADGILGKRGVTKWEGMEGTIVPQFLAEMEGLVESAAIVILATNRPDALDPAFLRPGRIDKKIEVGRPTEKDAADIFRKAIRGKPLAGKGHAEHAAAALFSSRQVIGMSGDGRERRRLTLADVVSGALVVELAERATQRAIRRAVEDPKDPGITLADIDASVAELLEEERALTGGGIGTGLVIR